MSDFDVLDERRRRIEGHILGNAHASDYSIINQIGTLNTENFYSSENGIPSAKLSSHPWTIPRGVSRLFTGRQETLEALSQAFLGEKTSSSSTERRFVLSGLGGTGKSEVCIKFAVDHRGNYWGVFWVDCTNEETAKESFKRIGNVCGIESSIENVKSWLSSTSQKWLLIVDNADDIKVNYSKFFPFSHNSDIIITTRNQDLCRKYATVGSKVLLQLESSLAEDLLLRTAGIPEEEWSNKRDVAQCVVEELGCHTLAVLHTGAFIIESQIEIEEYMQMLQQQRETHLETIIFESTRDQEHATYATVNLTFEISVQRIEALQQNGDRTAADALDLLNLLAFMHYEGDIRLVGLIASRYASRLDQVTEHVCADFFKLSSSHIDLFPPYYMRGVDDLAGKLRWNKACGMLRAFSFVHIDEEIKWNITHSLDLNVLAMHPLVHTWARQRQDFETQRHSWLKVATTLAFVCREGSGDSLAFEVIQSHTRVCLSQDVQRFSDATEAHVVAPLLWRFLMIQSNLIMDYKTEEIVEILYSRLRQEREKGTVGGDDADLATCNLLWLEGKWTHRRGELLKAVEQLEQVMSKLEKLVTEDHPACITVKGDLASAYRGNGQFKKAITTLEDIIRIRGDKSGEEEDQPRLEAQRELGTVYSLDRRTTEAVEMLEKVVDIQRRMFYEGHRGLVMSEQSLALTYLDTLDSAKRRKAVEMLEKIVESCERKLDEGHRQRLVYQHSLGLAYSYVEQYQNAISVLEHVQKVRAKILEEGNPLRLASECSLANAYRLNGEPQKAIKILERNVKLCENTFGEDHFERLNVEVSLGVAYMKNKRIGEAHKIFQHVVNIREKTLNADHADLLESQWQLVRVYQKTKNLKEAMKLIKHIIHKQQEKVNGNNSMLMVFKYTLYELYKDKHNYKKAYKIAKEVKAMIQADENGV